MPTNKTRVKTKYLGGGQAGGTLVATGVPTFAVPESWVVQDDIRVIGCELIVEINALDTHYNGDFHSQLIGELTRAATIEQSSCILSLQIEFGWTGIFSTGGGQRRNLVVMFPTGYGVDLDEGEILNVLLYASLTTGTGDCWHFVSAVVYYVER